jgi:16S rRNA (adenine(1408)-N(1))-methyltransferase
VSLDLGTGDGRLPFTLARQEPDRLFLGLDASAAGLREYSVRAARAGVTNVVYVRAAVESLPPELQGVADRLTVILPWGSLLAAVARPSPPLLLGIAALCRPGATLTVVVGIDPSRDVTEAARLGLPALDRAHLDGPLTAAYAAAGLEITSIRALTPGELAAWPSTWAKTLAHGRPRPVFRLDARRRPEGCGVRDGAAPPSRHG